MSIGEYLKNVRIKRNITLETINDIRNNIKDDIKHNTNEKENDTDDGEFSFFEDAAPF